MRVICPINVYCFYCNSLTRFFFLLFCVYWVIWIVNSILFIFHVYPLQCHFHADCESLLSFHLWVTVILSLWYRFYYQLIVEALSLGYYWLILVNCLCHYKFVLVNVFNDFLYFDGFKWCSMDWLKLFFRWCWLCQIWNSIHLIWQIVWHRSAIWQSYLVCCCLVETRWHIYMYELLLP